MFEDVAAQVSAGFLAAATEAVAKLPSQLGGPPYVHRRDLTATVTALDVTWQA